MARNRRRLGLAVVREAAFALGWWLAAATGLYLLAALMPVSHGEILAPPGPRSPAGVRYLEWLWRYSTLGFGYAETAGNVPVRAVLLAPFGRSLLVLATTAVVFAVLAVPVLTALARDEDVTSQPVATAASHPVTTAAASLVGSVPPFLWLFAYLVVAAGLDDLLGLPVFWSAGDGPLTKAISIGVLSVALALPFLGMAARRFRLWLAARRAAGEAASLRAALTVPAGDALRLGSLELWLAFGYLAGSLAAVESLVAYPGAGKAWIDALTNGDASLLFGAMALTLQLFVLAGFLRNLAWVADAARREHGDAEPAGDPGDPAIEGEPTDLPRTVATHPKVIVGAGGLAALLAVGLAGSLVLTPTQPDLADLVAGGSTFVTGPGHLLNSVASVVVVALLAVAVAVLLGVPVGALAGSIEGDGPLASAVGTALRVPSDAWLVPPLVLVVGGLYAAVPDVGGRTGYELSVGVTGGLVLAAYAFHVARIAARSQRRRRAAAASAQDAGVDVQDGAGVQSAGAGVRDSVGVHLVVRTTARVCGATFVVPFVAAELIFLWVGPRGTTAAISAVSELDEFRLAVYSETLAGVPVLLSAVAVVALPTLCLALLADGLREAELQAATDDGDRRSHDSYRVY